MLDFIEQTFISFLNMSITGSYIIVAIMLVRLLLKKAPKIFSYCLWAVAGFRLLCKFSFSSVLSIFNLFSVPSDTASVNGATVNGYIPDDIGTMPVPEISTGITAADAVINPVLPAANITESVNPMQIIVTVASIIWIVGMIAMAVYGVVSFIKVYKNVEFATKLDGNVFECESIKSPFVFGVIKPKIYLPCGMDEKQREYVIIHEKNHIKRLDHIIKLIAFAVLILHWYNPLVWFGYSLMIRDMEMSCDERVLKKLSEEEKKIYGLTLVSVGSSRRFAASAPLSFGENVVEERIVNILKFKKTKIIIAVICVILCVAVAAVCLTNAETEKDEYGELEAKIEAYIERDDTQCVASAEVVSVADNKAYCWLTFGHFDYTYSSYLNGETENELTELKNLINSTFESGTALDLQSVETTVPIEVHFSDDMEVLNIESITGDAPVDMGDQFEYSEKLWNEIADKAAEKYENAYGGKYNLKNINLINAEKLSNLYVIDYELVEYLGNPVMVMKVTNTMKSANTLQIPYYRIDSDFTVRALTEGSEAEGIQLERNDNTYAENSMYIIEGGSASGKEYLCIYELAPYIDTLNKNQIYFIDISVETPYGEKVDASIEFQVSSDKIFDRKPSLKYDDLASGFAVDITEKIGTPVYGWITQGYSNPINYPLTEDELKEIKNIFNKTKLTEKADQLESLNTEDAFCVQIRDDDSKIHSFMAVSLDCIADANMSNRRYTPNNAELYKTVADIYVEKQRQACESTTAAPTLPEGYVPQTKPPIQAYTTARQPNTGITRQPDLFTGVHATQAAATAEAKPYYAISDINSYATGRLSNIKFWGIKYTSAYTGGPYFLMTLINESGNEYYVKHQNNTSVTNGYTLERLEGGQWKTYNDTSVDLDTDTSKLYQNTISSLLLPVSELKNGNYRLSLPIYESNEKAGNVTVEFAVTKYMAKEAPAGSKIENATSFTVTPRYSGVEHTLTNISEEDKAKIVEYYNSFEVIPAERPSSSLSYVYIEITDSQGNLHSFSVAIDGTVYQNGTYFKPQNGKLMFELLYSLYLK